jgi:hypothetical protein
MVLPPSRTVNGISVTVRAYPSQLMLVARPPPPPDCYAPPDTMRRCWPYLRPRPVASRAGPPLSLFASGCFFLLSFVACPASICVRSRTQKLGSGCRHPFPAEPTRASFNSSIGEKRPAGCPLSVPDPRRPASHDGQEGAGAGKLIDVPLYGDTSTRYWDQLPA